MKKIIALILCALMALSCGAFAETFDTAWRVTIDGMEITSEGTNIVLTPTLEGYIGETETGYWGEGSVLLNGEKVMTMQGLFGEDQLSLTLDGSNDTLVVSDLAQILYEDFDIDADLTATAEMLYDTFEDSSWIDTLIPQLAESGVTITANSDSDYTIAYAEDGEAVKLHISWEKVAMSMPAFAEKNIVTYDYNTTTLPETDLFDVAKDCYSKISGEPSVQQLRELLSDVEEELEL